MWGKSWPRAFFSFSGLFEGFDVQTKRNIIILRCIFVYFSVNFGPCVVKWVQIVC